MENNKFFFMLFNFKFYFMQDEIDVTIEQIALNYF